MREIKFNVYTYDELSEKAKENALKGYDEQMSGDDACIAVEDEIAYIESDFLPEKGFSDVKIEATDSRGYWNDWEVRIKGYIDAKKLSEAIGEDVLPEYSDGTISINYPQYVIDCECLPEDEKKRESVLAKIEGYYDDICREIGGMLEREVDYVYSDEYKIETMLANEWEFKEDGTWYQ